MSYFSFYLFYIRSSYFLFYYMVCSFLNLSFDLVHTIQPAFILLVIICMSLNKMFTCISPTNFRNKTISTEFSPTYSVLFQSQQLSIILLLIYSSFFSLIHDPFYSLWFLNFYSMFLLLFVFHEVLFLPFFFFLVFCSVNSYIISIFKILS